LLIGVSLNALDANVSPVHFVMHINALCKKHLAVCLAMYESDLLIMNFNLHLGSYMAK